MSLLGMVIALHSTNVARHLLANVALILVGDLWSKLNTAIISKAPWFQPYDIGEVAENVWSRPLVCKGHAGWNDWLPITTIAFPL